MAGGVSSSHGTDRGMAPVSVAVPARIASDPPPTFREVLDALNPLQYLPVVGTIYRVVTGDQGSPGIRTAVSAIVGVLMGGPVGLLTSMAGDLFERMVHPETVVHAALFDTLAPAVTLPPARPPAPAIVSRAIMAYTAATQRVVGVGR